MSGSNCRETAGLHSWLSGSVVDTFERCGLRFLLERDWRLSERPAPAMQAPAIHRVLKTYFDSAEFRSRPKTDDELIELFATSTSGRPKFKRLTCGTLENQGTEQLRDFLAPAWNLPPAQVLHTEQSFDIRLIDIAVVGRIDRDRSPASMAALHSSTTKLARPAIRKMPTSPFNCLSMLSLPERSGNTTSAR